MIKGACRGICFILTAFLTAGFVHSLPLWIVVITGGFIGVTAGIGWEDGKDKS
jgi:hypothetical protein